MTTYPLAAAGVLLLSIATVAGCGSAPADPTRAGLGTGSMGDLAGRSFVSTSVTKSGTPTAPVHGTTITVRFTDHAVSASAGCNSMGGAATLDNGVLRVTKGLVSTEMGCAAPLMDQDRWLADLVTSGPDVILDANRLTLTSGGTVVEFEDEQTARPPLPLTETVWTLDAIGSTAPDGAVSSIPHGVSSTLQIDVDGNAAIRPGCNTGHASVDLADGTLTFGPVAITRMMCADDQMSVEGSVLSVLDGEVTYTIEHDTLTIVNGEQSLTYLG